MKTFKITYHELGTIKYQLLKATDRLDAIKVAREKYKISAMSVTEVEAV